MLFVVSMRLVARFSAMSTNSKNFGDNIRVPKRTMSRWVLSNARPTLYLVSADAMMRLPVKFTPVARCNVILPCFLSALYGLNLARLGAPWGGVNYKFIWIFRQTAFGEFEYSKVIVAG